MVHELSVMRTRRGANVPAQGKNTPRAGAAPGRTIQHLFPIHTVLVFLAVAALHATACGQREDFQVQGETMGTVYSVRVVDAPAGARTGIEADIARRLEELNALLSAYRPKSEISRFNALADTDQALAVGREFQDVLNTSIHVHELTGGAFDPTVKPLIDLWGFGPAARRSGQWRPPDREAVAQALESASLEKIDASAPGWVRKMDQRVQLDFGAVAKGYAVDQIAAILRGHGIEHFLVNIGGDMLASGSNHDRGAWRIGVNRPVPDADWDDVVMVLKVQDRAVATSGDYRRFIGHQGRRFSHVIDPRTGQAVQTSAAGVTVVADTAVFADALATGLMVLGVEEGLRLVERLANVEALFVVRSDGGVFDACMSSGFSSYSTDAPMETGHDEPVRNIADQRQMCFPVTF